MQVEADAIKRSPKVPRSLSPLCMVVVVCELAAAPSLESLYLPAVHGPRIQTTHATVTSNVSAAANTALTLWDPLYPMQEVYRQDGSYTLFYLYGPDLSDTVGGLGGIGGLLAYRENGFGRQVFSDMRRNVVGAVDYYYLDFNPWWSACSFF